ncbi:uncharacterized protein LOC144906358 [Branchiostoma floridae x Branchiostoma belcheri]
MKALVLLLACLGLVGVQGFPVSDVGDREAAKAIGGMANVLANLFDRFPFAPPIEDLEEVEPEVKKEVEETKEPLDENDSKPAPEEKEEPNFDDMFAKSALGMMKGMENMMKGFQPMMSDMMKDFDDMPSMGDMMKDLPMMGEIDINLDKEDPDFSKETTESKKVAGDTIVTHKKESKHTGKDGSVSYVSEVDKKQGGGHSYSVVKVYDNSNFQDLFGPDAVPSPTPMPELPEDEAVPDEDIPEDPLPDTEGDTTTEEDELDPALFGPDAIPSPTPMPGLPMEEEIANSIQNPDGGHDDDNDEPAAEEEEQLNRALFFEPADDEARKSMFDLI